MNDLICMAQLNPLAGNIEHNKNKAIECIKKAIKNNASLVIFPQMYLLGYPMGDILYRYPSVAKHAKKALDEIKSYCENINVLIGYPEIEEKSYYNSICFIQNKEIKRSIRKSVISKKSIYHEYSYFEAEKFNLKDRIFELNGKKYGIIICDDILFEKKFDTDLILQLISEIDILICCASNHTRMQKEQFEHNVLKDIAKKYKTKIIYVNQTGGSDDLVYTGLSRIYDEGGEISALIEPYKEDCKITDINEKKHIENSELDKTFENEFSLNYEPYLEYIHNTLVYAIKEYFSKTGFKRAVLGLSGGLDSSVCAVLLADALGKENVLGVSMPSKITSSNSKNDAQILAQNLGIHFIEAPIKETQDLIASKFSEMFDNINWCNRYTSSYTQDNIQARSRATILWGIANEYPETLPIATSDKSESYMGYATINGDMSGGYAPILDVTKTKLFALAKWMNKNRIEKNAIPNSVIEKPPGAELAINPKTGKTLTAEEALMPYEFLDEVIWRIENKNQMLDDMTKEVFLYEKNHELSSEQKLVWLEKFFKRMQGALYKWHIVPPAPVIDIHSINSIEYRQPITSKINYKENLL
ncbi:MAG: NAD(+) synthase [Candidatus Gastranaerophilales bacterium]|nr:NAD(+) synthase [Candidatus Gastranaerophilales bacterium]